MTEQHNEPGSSHLQVTYTAWFQEPAFQLPKQSHVLQRSLFRVLQPFGLSWPHFQEQGALAGSASWHITAKLERFAASLEIRVNGMELDIGPSSSFHGAELSRLAESVEEAVLGAIEPIPIARRELSFKRQLAADEQARAAIRSYSGPAPEGLGEPDGQAAMFYFKNPLFDGECSVLFDQSARIEHGFHFRINCQFDATRFSATRTVEHFREYLGKVDDAFCLRGNLLGKDS